jgi:hypothetical protein
MFYLYVSKVDFGVAHVEMAIHACFKHMCNVYTHMFKVFHLLSDVCCKCFILMFQSRSWCCTCCNSYTRMFQTYVQCLYTHVSSVSSAFRRMLQMFYLDVLSRSGVARVFFTLVLHML